MSFTDAVKSVFSNYATFSGRARRSEYWYFVLFNLIISLLLSLLGNKFSFFTFISGIYSLAIIVPSLAVAVRRLHDTGRSGWFFFLSFIPLANLYLLYLLCVDSEPGDNEYGPNPKDTVIM